MKKQKTKIEKKSKISRRGLRAKGNTFERDIARDLREAGFIHAARHLEFQTSNAVGVDLDHTGPFRIQCKSFKKYPSMSLIKEIRDKTGAPLLVAKGNGEQPLVAMEWSFFLKIMGVWMRSLSPEKRAEYKFHLPEEMDLGF